MMAATRSALPGFRPALAITLGWVSLIVLLPLASLILRPWELGAMGVWHAITEPRVLAALRLSFGAAAVGLVMLLVSFSILLLLNLLQKRMGVRPR